MLIETTACPYCLSGVNTPCFAIYTDGHHCFTCGKTKRANRDYCPTIVNNTAHKSLETHAIESLAVLQWLASYQVDRPLARRYGVEEADGESVVFSCEDFYQRRYIVDKRIYNYGKKPYAVAGTSKTVVIVEDPVSWIRVCENVAGFCLFGTKMQATHARRLVTDYTNVVLWLDGDDAGKEASQQINKLLIKELYYYNKRYMLKDATNIHTLHTEKDPKCYTNTEIKSFIQGVLC